MTEPAALTLYAESGWISPWVFHAMTALAEKGLAYRLEVVSLPITGSDLSALTERAVIGKVPVLVHDPLWLSESLAISEYLAETFRAPDYPRLFPADLGDRARARQIMSFVRTDLFALRDARPTSSVFGTHATGALTAAARAQADELLRIATQLLAAGHPNLFADWCIADADLALALMRLRRSGDPMSTQLIDYAERQWQRPSLQPFLTRTARG
jgi:glutathione S-transferase